ncbi:zinc-dependent metalloprotease [Rothia sp. AR01]|uniref:Zinc-dependent metalloprotease n=1 Tax=Rothia santali TaxID=2949643 RepID=A0A9X2HKL0_9MICC|nr:zinc-dependent metalloprotease [Rothia santali]MCP3426648.1 zinc-dependent metalloprotease [Rothia santali]
MTEDIISWEAAAATAARLTPAGPKLSRAEARAAVESIRYHASASVDHVHRITGLDAAERLHDSQLLVVDRQGWSRANSQTFSMMLNRLVTSGMGDRLAQLNELDRKVTEAGAALELGGVLAFLSARVLGQYDPFAALGGFGAPGGRLMLVAPNIVMIERELNLDPDDFRLWVCLHEQTHRVQFAAAPWLREHMLGLIAQLPQHLEGGGAELLRRLLDGAAEGVRALADRSRKPGTDDAGPGADADAATGAGGPGPAEERPAPAKPLPTRRITALLDERTGKVFSDLTAIMSLMEGHANVVMDAIGPETVPSVKTIRRRFERRSATRGALERMIRTALGLDLKMRQYRDGQEFVQAIVDRRGMAELNRVWERAENLPSEEEIHDPSRWIARVLDGRAGA